VFRYFDIVVRFFSLSPIAMHLWFEDRQGKTYEIEDTFCPMAAY